MHVERYVRGDTAPLVVVLKQLDGTPYDLSGCVVRLLIHVEGVCLEVAGTVPDPLLGAVLFALGALDLPARVLRASLSVTWSDGTVETPSNFTLRVKEAC